MNFEYIMLFSYFLFLFGLLIAANNIPRIAAHPAAEALAQKITYNLRDIPRVNYKEPSSDDEEDSHQEQGHGSESESESEKDTSVDNSYAGTEEVLEGLRKRYRNDPIAMSRVLDSLD